MTKGFAYELKIFEFRNNKKLPGCGQLRRASARWWRSFNRSFEGKATRLVSVRVDRRLRF